MSRTKSINGPTYEIIIGIIAGIGTDLGSDKEKKVNIAKGRESN